MRNPEVFKLPVKSKPRAKMFYEEFFTHNIDPKRIRNANDNNFKDTEYLYEEKNDFIPNTAFMVYTFTKYKNVKVQLENLESLGGNVLVLKKISDQNNYQALIRDSEGNRIIILFTKKR